MKHPRKSWTIIFNLILVGIGIFYPDLSDATRGILITIGTTNIGLRFKTDTGVKL